MKDQKIDSLIRELETQNDLKEDQVQMQAQIDLL